MIKFKQRIQIHGCYLILSYRVENVFIYCTSVKFIVVLLINVARYVDVLENEAESYQIVPFCNNLKRLILENFYLPLHYQFCFQ